MYISLQKGHRFWAQSFPNKSASLLKRIVLTSFLFHVFNCAPASNSKDVNSDSADVKPSSDSLNSDHQQQRDQTQNDRIQNDGRFESQTQSDDSLPGTIEIDANTITFVALPTGAMRLSVSGFSAATGMCASVWWTLSGSNASTEIGCSELPWTDVPSGTEVYFELGHTAPCTDFFDLATEATVSATTGCASRHGYSNTELAGVANLRVTVASADFNGDIVFNNQSRARLCDDADCCINDTTCAQTYTTQSYCLLGHCANIP
jgi:hypothetical protein